jgi:hypothetical protein
LLSSAILYVAIVAIWAGVLIPRWLRRDSAAGGRGSENLSTAEEKPEVAEEPVAAPAPRRREDAAVREAPPARIVRPVRREERVAAPVPARPEPRAEVPSGGPRERDHKRVLSARRRLLGMLLALAFASGWLAYTRMAAWWVVVPPTVMLLGYLGMLREASKADAERRELARTRAAAAVAEAAAKHAAPPAPAAPAPAPDAEVIDISASLTVAGHKFYDQYADAKLRAVGD